MEDPGVSQAPVSVMVTTSAAESLKMYCRGSHRSIVGIRNELSRLMKMRLKKVQLRIYVDFLNFPSRVILLYKITFFFPCSCCGQEWRLLCNEGEGDCDSDDQVGG